MGQTCSDCGAPLPMQSGRGRPRVRCVPCSDKRRGKVVTLRREPEAPPAAPGGLLAGVRAQLDAVGRSDTVDGLAALDAAAALDGGAVTGAARAALLREMRVAANDALRVGPAEGGLIDELRDKREQKASG
jgi:hypothetical protein